MSVTAALSSETLLRGQRVLVTGAGRGIGRAMALICHEAGARVAITSRTVQQLEETAALEGNNGDGDSNCFKILPCDVTAQDQVQGMIQEIVKEWGGIDILINNCGGAQRQKGPADTLYSADLRDLLDLNVVAVHTVTSCVLQHAMQGSTGGQIVNISSRAGKMGLPNMSFYVASKFALEGYTAAVAAELQDRGVRVNSLSPGMVDTASFPKAPGKPGVRTAESVRDGLLTLLTTDVTGHYLHVDELDQARAKGLPDSVALKPINEPMFSP
jgi:NAD(P)-dependent dehydrogenase (short-subunit alcohol dehydrogenase family)